MEANANVIRFLRICDELCLCNYTDAEEKIDGLMLLISKCKELTDVFDAVTNSFDYIAAQNELIRTSVRDGMKCGEISLPTEKTKRLAFIFCLLVDVRSEKWKWKDFLQTYFYVDGSYTASYSAFVVRLIRPFRDLVANCFPLEKSCVRAAAGEKSAADKFADAIKSEMQRIASLGLDPINVADGNVILTQLLRCVDKHDQKEIEALLCGYSYFLSMLHVEKGSEALFVLAEKY